MSRKRLCFLTETQLVAYLWVRGKLVGRECFGADEEGLLAFSRYLNVDAYAPIYVLVDLLAEEFNNQTIPHVRGPDRVALLRHRASQAFRGTPFRFGVVRGRESTGRRDDQAVFMGISEAVKLSRWVDVLEKTSSPLAGIYSLPMVGESLLGKIKIPDKYVLLVSHQSGSGLRLSFYANRRLKMSRMARIPQLHPEEYTATVIREIGRTWDYLQSVRLLQRSQAIGICILCNSSLLVALRPFCVDTALFTYHLIAIGELAEKIGVKQTISSPFSDSLFIQLLGKKTPVNHYASAASRRFYITWRWRNAMSVVSLLLVLIVAPIVVVWVHTGIADYEKGQLLKQQVDSFVAEKRDKLSQSLPTLIRPADLKNMVLLGDTILEQTTTPWEMMVIISQDLQHFSDISLNKLEWYAFVNQQDIDIGKIADNQKRRIVASGGQRRLQSGQGDAEGAKFYGRVENIDGNLKYAIQRVHDFVSRLEKNQHIRRVIALQLPMEMQSKEVFSGNVVDLFKPQKAETADFVLWILREKTTG